MEDMMGRRAGFASALVLVVLWTAALAIGWSRAETPADLSTVHPRTACYSANRSDGSPFVKPGGALDSLRLQRLARWGVRCVEADPACTTRPDIVGTLRYYSAGRGLTLCYRLVGFMWVGPDWQPRPDDHTFATETWRIIHDTGGFLYGTDGRLWHDNFNVNLGNRETARRIGAQFATLARLHLVDGLFLDDCNTRVAWTDNGWMGRELDLARAGFASHAAIDSAFAVNAQAIIDTIRAAAPPGFVIITNQGDALAGVDGNMREGVGAGLNPWPSTLSWVQASAARYDWVKTEGGWGGNPYTANDCRRFRVGQAIAVMGDAVAGYSPDRDLTASPYFGDWLYDEMLVVNGRADTTGAGAGWLGPIVGPVQSFGPGLYMADLPRGRVLLNLSGDAFDFDMRAPYWRRLYGRRDPITNNGMIGTGPSRSLFRVPAGDALFLWRTGGFGLSPQQRRL